MYTMRLQRILKQVWGPLLKGRYSFTSKAIKYMNPFAFLHGQTQNKNERPQSIPVRQRLERARVAMISISHKQSEVLDLSSIVKRHFFWLLIDSFLTNGMFVLVLCTKGQENKAIRGQTVGC